MHMSVYTTYCIEEKRTCIHHMLYLEMEEKNVYTPHIILVTEDRYLMFNALSTTEVRNYTVHCGYIESSGKKKQFDMSGVCYIQSAGYIKLVFRWFDMKGVPPVLLVSHFIRCHIVCILLPAL